MTQPPRIPSPARRRLAARIAGLGAAALLPGAWAQSGPYPNRVVKIQLGYAPGGSADIMARLICEYLGNSLKQSFIVENRPGASGNIAVQNVARAPADGYTLLFGNPAEMVVNKILTKDLGFDPDADFVPVVQVFNIPLGLVVPAKSAYKSLADLVEDARRQPKKVTFASAGGGSPGHLAGEALALKGKAPMTHVPYKGAAPALVDVIGGHVDCYFSGLTPVAQHIKSGAVRLLALSSAQRSSLFPDTPTVAETLIPGFDFTLWGGLFAATKTPPEIVRLLNAEANQAYARADFQTRIQREQSDVIRNTPEQFAAYIKSQSEKYRQIIKDIGYTG
ncbi:MAG: tripartite tricarboxylate transporter substrate binding protein [Betaproteobacteria bacterium]